MSDPRTLIVVPCYNEEQRLPVEEFRRFAQERPEFRFLFVNDGSRDGTGALIAHLAAENPRAFEALQLPQNGGKAEAVRQGFLHGFRSQPKFIGFWDADLATPLSDIPDFEEILHRRPEFNMVIGARVQLLGREINRRILRHYVGRGFATVASNYLRVEIYDTQCGAKLFRNNRLLHRIFAKRWVARWLFDVEILTRYLKVMRREHPELKPHFGICEVPLQRWTDVKGSKVKLIDFPKALGELVRIILTYR